MMVDAESPATVFDILYLGMPQGIQQNVIYDNGCHLLDYMLGRDPQWARNKNVYIDALHFAGHTGCAHSFNTGTNLQCTQANC
jgi:hypothetical protein